MSIKKINNRQGWKWQIAKHWFLVTWNVMKMRYSNKVLYAHLRKLSKTRVEFSSTAILLDSFYEKYCSVFENLPNF